MTQGYQNVFQLDQSLPIRLLTRPASIDAIVKHQLVKFFSRQNQNRFNDIIHDSIHDSIHDCIHDCVHDSINDSIHDSVHDSIHNCVHDIIHDIIHDNIHYNIHASIDDTQLLKTFL